MSRSAQEILEDARQLPLGEMNWLIESLLQQERDDAPGAEIEAAWTARSSAVWTRSIPGPWN